MDGLLLVDKPAGITSHDTVDRVRRALGVRRVGHAGTLDPMASGLLVMGVGRGTRLLRFLSAFDKEYEGTATLGVDTDTLDAEGTVTTRAPVDVSPEAIRKAFADLTGDLLQAPPTFSAVKVGGRPLHRAARAGAPVAAQPRPVRVEVFDLVSYDPPNAAFRVVCSTGTYVRVLVSDVGRALGCGAHLSRLVRTRVGPFALADARSPGEPGNLLPLEAAVAHLPSITLTSPEVEAAGHGRPLGPAGLAGPYAALDPEGGLVGVYADEGAKAVPEVIVRPSTRGV